MHTTTKDVVSDSDVAKTLNVPIGTHIVTTVIEGDGPVAIASDKAKLSAKVISTSRTDSGGVQVQTAVFVSEPAPAPAPEPAAPAPTPTDQAIAYFTSKGLSADAAKTQVERFGVQRVLAAKDKELDDELAKAVAPPEPPTAPATPGA